MKANALGKTLAGKELSECRFPRSKLQIIDGTSRFCPPRMIARDEPYCLFLDELNACSHEVQQAFYSLIDDRRIGEYYLPKASIVIGAGNRAQDSDVFTFAQPHGSCPFESCYQLRDCTNGCFPTRKRRGST